MKKINQLIIILVGILLIASPLKTVEGISTTNLISYYSFDVNTTADSHGSNTGAEVGTVSRETSSPPCGAGFLETGLGGYLNIGSDTSLDFISTDSFSVCGWQQTTGNNLRRIFHKADTSAPYSGIWWGIQTSGAGSIPYIQMYDLEGDLLGRDGTTDINDDTWRFICFTYDGSGTDAGINFYVNNVSEGSNAGGGVFGSFDTGAFDGFICGDSLSGGWEGACDDVSIWDKELSQAEVGDLYNVSNCNNPVGAVSPPVNDTTPPSITGVVQEPNNLTILNAIETEVKINATITDNIQLDNTTVKLWLNATHIEVYINGTRLNHTNRNITYTNATGSNYRWFLDENDYLSATHNLNHDIFENEEHFNNTLTSANRWLKMEFLNVSNSSDLMFTEIMDTNSTGIAEYYYCNDDYITGNPISSEFCTIFYTQTGNDFMHIHKGKGRTFHRLMVMGVNKTNGELNGIPISPISYILKRGSNEGETYFYINNMSRVGATATTTNNGNAWTNQIYTVNSQIHQIHINESIFYQICASDNSSNSACSSIVNDTIDFVQLPPSAPTFISPELFEIVNGTLEIQYTPSVSPTGQSITTYRLDYKINTSASWTNIEANNYPSLSYDWDTTFVNNGNYNLRIYVTDSANLTSFSISPEFVIMNPQGLDVQLLTDIKGLLTDFLALFEEVFGMIFEIIWIALFLILALKFSQPLFMALSSFGFGLIALRKITTGIDNNYDLILTVFTFILLFVFFFAGIVMFYINLSKSGEKEKEKGGLQRIYN